MSAFRAQKEEYKLSSLPLKMNSFVAPPIWEFCVSQTLSSKSTISSCSHFNSARIMGWCIVSPPPLEMLLISLPLLLLLKSSNSALIAVAKIGAKFVSKFGLKTNHHETNHVCHNPPSYGYALMPLHPAHSFRLGTGHVSQSFHILVCKSINIQQPFLELPNVYSQRSINGML